MQAMETVSPGPGHGAAWVNTGMRYADLMESKRQSLAAREYLHGSRHILTPGTLLAPRGEALAGVDDDVEETLEKARPPDKPRRDAVVYMARDMRTLENVARDADYVYVVTPVGDLLRLDGAWINRLWSWFAEYENALHDPAVVQQARRYAQGYWSGHRCPPVEPGHETIWEYMAAQARVVREL